MNEQHLGNLFIVAAPSGGGKTTLVKQLVSSLDDIAISISHTTRDQRPGEIDGEHYFFTSHDQFQTMVQAGDFLEHAHVFGHYYGTSHVQINNRLNQGIDIILDIDWQGAAQIKKYFPNAISIFILPPSLHALEQRLIHRQRDNLEVIEQRMKRACEEMSHYSAFDYLIINDDFDKAFLDLKAIIIAYRLRIQRQMVKQRKLLSFLLTSQ